LSALKSKFNTHKPLILCLVLLLVTLVIDEIVFSDQNRRVNPQESISANLAEQLAILDAKTKEVSSTAVVDLNRLFNRLPPSEEYAFFIYENGQILYWSTNRFVPKYGTLEGTYFHKYLEINQDKFIVKRNIINTSQNRLVEIYGFLTLQSDVPVTEQFLKTGLNGKVFGKTRYQLQSLPPSDEGKLIKSPQGISLFSFEGNQLMKVDYPLYSLMIVILYAIGMSLYLWAAFRYANGCKNKGMPILALALLAAMLALLRAAMIKFDFPYSVWPYKLFDPSYFAASSFEPSLGDLLLNHIGLLMVVGYGFSLFFEKIVLIKRHTLLLISLTLLSFAAFYYLTEELHSTLSNSQWELDITKDNSLNIFKLMNYLVIFIEGIMFFLLTQLAASMYLVSDQKRWLGPLAMLVFLIAVVISVVTTNEVMIYLSIFTAYLMLIVRLRFPDEIIKISYNTFLYFFFASFVVALVSTIVLNEEIKSADRQDKTSIATELLASNDLTAEFLLSEAKTKVQEDILIQTNISNSFSSKQLIRQRIRRSYLGEYFDKYDIEVLLFSGKGKGMNNPVSTDYYTFARLYSQDEYATDHESLYFINSQFPSIINQYYLFIDIKRYDTVIGYIVLKLDKKEQLNNSILPRLLFEETDEIVENNHFDYAIFQNGVLTSSVGDFNYERDFPLDWQIEPGVFKGGIETNGYTHLAIQGRDAKEFFVISSPVYPLRFKITNFSLFFLFSVAMIILVFFISAIFHNLKKSTVTIAAKVQILLNFAFFLPLIIVSIVVLRLVNDTVKRNIEENYLDLAESAGNNLTSTLENFLNSQSENNETLENRVAEISQYARADINLYNASGVLIATNQRMIFENQILSSFVNPKAMAEIIENKTNEKLYEERVGELIYQSTYVGIRSPEENKILGVLSMPFFESETQLKIQQTDIISNILNAFTFIFIVFVLLSFLASRIITYPFKYLTERIKATTFSNINQPLEWSAEDEIGLMVREYNRMLINLERSKKELALSEKESAWREMAQQVAHEIKNPLTPMKLKLQHLKRILKEGRGLNQDFNKPIDSLLNQVDSLSDIATSFSSFAKMPIPINERLDIADSLRKVVRLFKADNVEINPNIPRNPIWVECDANLLGRIFNNLILNAIQAMPEGRTPQLEISMEKTHSKVRISVADNGAGIPDDIRDKVFIPKFSTKVEGSGIGLAIAKRGVEHAGGSIWFETEPSEGTTFFLEFPLTD
jgi:two-component system nitrogen regulation sensor histidine kinase NtrY